jgi:Xaa-Pro aminopeptidase
MGMIKTNMEIELLKKSAKISDSCIPVIEQSLKERITEKELARRINKKIRSQGAKLSFQTLVASGKRSHKIHPRPYSSKKLICGIGYADFGASYKGYKTDITVPFIKGGIGKKERKIVETNIRAYEIAASSVRIGEPCWKLFKKTNDYMRKNGFKMQHGLGHGIGLKVHEFPHLVMPRKKKLTAKKKRLWDKIRKITFQPGMVFTIEPGIYVKKVGGCRIENDFLLTKKSLKQLTHSRLLKA